MTPQVSKPLVSRNVSQRQSRGALEGISTFTISEKALNPSSPSHSLFLFSFFHRCLLLGISAFYIDFPLQTPPLSARFATCLHGLKGVLLWENQVPSSIGSSCERDGYRGLNRPFNRTCLRRAAILNKA